MTNKITPSVINGQLQAPASKSVVQRVLAAALLSNGASIINGYTPCDDALAAISIIKSLGALVVENNRQLQITGYSLRNKISGINILHCGESGLASRLFAPISLLFNNNIELNGEGSLLRRPFAVMEHPFAQLGVQCSTNNGFLPLYLKGEIKAGYIKVDGSTGSQFLSGLLMALPLLAGNSIIEVENLQSKPYIDLTIEVLCDFGINIEHDNYLRFNIKGNQQYKPCEYTIEGDWSGASCLLVAAAVAGRIELTGLKTTSMQADKAIIDVLKIVGANVVENNNSIVVSKNKLQAFTFDATHCPDLFPALAVLAANCNGVSCITGTSRLINKESNRALTLQTELANVGVKVELKNNNMIVHGGSIEGGSTFAHNDHRIAMAMAVAGLTAKNEVSIEGTGCVNKSYPAFFDDLKSVQINN